MDKTDVLIIGGGIGGAFAAIKAKEAGVEKVMLLSKGKLGMDGASTFGAGVYYAVAPEDKREDVFKRRPIAERYGAPALYAGGALFDEEWLNIAYVESYERLCEMDKWGVGVVKGPDGKFHRRMTRGNEMVYQIPGPKTMEAMARKVLSSGVDVTGNVMITGLLTAEGKPGDRVIGAVGFDVRTGEFKSYEAKSVVLATGGCGFKSTWSGHRNLTGDGLAAAYHAGAVLSGFESGNLIVPGVEYDIMGQNPLVGFGAHWVNRRGERYMLEYDPECEDRAPTARLSEATVFEILAGRGPIYIDISHFTSSDIEKFKVLYPLTVAMLERGGIIVGNKVVKKVEVEPAFVGTFNSTGGGLRVNTSCETSLPGLYALGDAMKRYLHNPVAISGAAITGARAGKAAAAYANSATSAKVSEEQMASMKRSIFSALDRRDGVDPEHVIQELYEILLPYDVSIIAREEKLKAAINKLEVIKKEELPHLYALDPHGLRLALETRNMCLVAEMFLRSRLMRQESRETCLREDFPYVDNENWLKWTCLQQQAGEMHLYTEDLPLERYLLKPQRTKFMHPLFEIAQKRSEHGSSKNRLLAM